MANPTGKGGFGDRPEDINRNGAPTKDKSWRGAVSRLTNMTREELIEYVGAKSRMGKLLKELPPGIPVKDALILIGIVGYGRDPSPGWFNALADREDGKPAQAVDVTSGGEKVGVESMKPSEIAARVAAILKDKDVGDS